MTKNLIGKTLDRMSGATRQAFQSAAQSTGRETDPDLALYGTLKEDDFRKIADQYGMNETIQYIQKMEAKRLMGGKSA